MEIWTATTIENENDKELIVFLVKDKETEKTREERRYKNALPLMFVLGGYPPEMGFAMQGQSLPWRFTKHNNGHIYIEDESHPIAD